MTRLSGLLWLVLLLCSGCVIPQRNPVMRIHQAIWINRWDYRSAEDVRTTIRNAAEAGFDTVLFQVRGNATSFFRSAREPWAEEYSYRNPGFDPLALAIEEGKAQGVAIHAWINVMPGWRGEKAPPPRVRQLYNTHPEWFLLDQFGKPEPLKKNGYVLLNPCYPEVQSYLGEICEDLARRYDLAGIHLDYIRFLDAGTRIVDGKRVRLDYPRDARTLRRYRHATGKGPEEDPERWDAWRAAQITEVVARIRRGLRRVRPSLLLTAAVFPLDPDETRRRFKQDWPTWLERGLVDAVFPMNYVVDPAAFTKRSHALLQAAKGKPVFMGLGIYKHKDPALSIAQMNEALKLGCAGYGLYAYASFFDSAAPFDPGSPAELERARREQILFLVKERAKRRSGSN